MKAEKQLRVFTPYERTQLARAGVTLEHAQTFGRTTPVEYITNRAEFCELTFMVTPDTLIPRVETQELVEKVYADLLNWQKENKNKKPFFLDIGTGSGAIAIALSHKLARAHIAHDWTGCDISTSALKIARHNARSHLGLTAQQAQKHFVESNVLAFLHDSYPQLRPTHIIANLPYIPNEEFASLDASVLEHEPETALRGGADGLKLINKLLMQISELKTKPASIWLEVSHVHTRPVWKYWEQFFRIEVLEDSLGRNRFVHLIAH